jgi:hypothetical protein
MNRTFIEKDEILSGRQWVSEKEGCLTTLNQVIGSIVVGLVFSLVVCLCVGLPWYLFNVQGMVKALISIVIIGLVWVVSGVVIRGIFNSKTML